MTGALIARGLLEADATTVMVAYLTLSGEVLVAPERDTGLTHAAADVPAGPLWTHVKSGGVYAELTRGRRAGQTERFVVYISLRDGRVWFRPEENFMDGRFTPATTRAVLAHLN